MSFKENLLKKIEIDKLTQKVLITIGSSESGRKVDRDAMRSLLAMGSFTLKQERDLDLYFLDADGDRRKILVLDNELAIYHTTVEDVALRKSPTIKEMLSIRNAIKILNDSDVVLSKKEQSVKTVQKACIDLLDLSFDESDLEAIASDGIASLENRYPEGVVEGLALFAELLGYTTPPKAFKISNHKIIGALAKKESGEPVFGPMVIYSLIHNVIKWIEDQVGSFDKAKIEWIHQVAMGKEDPSGEGTEVFQYLKEAVVNRDIWSLPT